MGRCICLGNPDRSHWNFVSIVRRFVDGADLLQSYKVQVEKSFLPFSFHHTENCLFIASI